MNGQEEDNEIFQGAMGAEYWEYDSRIGRRWNIDPMVNESESPYACFNNNPILMNDPDGLAPKTTGFVGFLRSIWTGIKHPFNRGRRNAEFHYGTRKTGDTKTHWSIGGVFMKIVGALRGGTHYHLSLIPQGRMRTRTQDYSGSVPPGGKDEIRFRRDIKDAGPFTEKVTGVYGEMWNDDATWSPIDGWQNEGKIDGYAFVEGMEDGWTGIGLNTGLRGWMPSALRPKELGGILVGAEMIPGLNFLDDIFGGIFQQLRMFELINKAFINPRHRYTTALRVRNSKHTKHTVGYYLTIKYRFWQRATNWGRGSNRSKLWRKLHRK
jgi:hypothetical protein